MKKKIRPPKSVVNKRFRRKLKSKEKQRKRRRGLQKNQLKSKKIRKAIRRVKPLKETTFNYERKIKRLINKGVVLEDEIYFYDADPESQEYESMFQFYQNNLKNQIRFGIGESCYYFQNDESINAAAIKSKNQYSIRINKGLMTHMMSMFKNNPNLLDHPDLVRFSEFDDILDIPNHILMYQNAGHFVFYHELGHLYQYVSLTKKILQEELNDTGSFNALKHLTEMDADEFAGISMASHISQYFERYQNVANSDRLLKNIVTLVVSSIILYILSFPSNRVPLYYKEKTHPHPVIRVLAVSFTIISHLIQLLSIRGINIQLNSEEIFKDALEVSQIIETDQWGSSLCKMFKENVENNPIELYSYIEELKNGRIGIKYMAVNRRNRIARKIHDVN